MKKFIYLCKIIAIAAVFVGFSMSCQPKKVNQKPVFEEKKPSEKGKAKAKNCFF